MERGVTKKSRKVVVALPSRRPQASKPPLQILDPHALHIPEQARAVPAVVVGLVEVSVPDAAVPRSLHPHLAQGALPYVGVLPEGAAEVGVHPSVGAEEGVVAVGDTPLHGEYRPY